ncbi:MAG: fatty acid desaturase [Deltaproteobacteria bacterium]|nr:fatty acid desaturase [Deltaproteobacteria bacterium]
MKVTPTGQPTPLGVRLRQEVERRLKPTRGWTRGLSVRLSVLGVAWLGLYASILSGHLPCTALVATMALLHLTLFELALTAHDGSHDAVSSSPVTNHLVRSIFDLVGVSSYLWDYDHVQAHHGYPNVPGYDSNLRMYPGLRLDPQAPRRWYHRFQHLYAPLVYAHATIAKVLIADFANLRRDRIGAVEVGAHPKRSLAWMLGLKAVALLHIYVLPFVVLSDPAWQIALSMYVGNVLSGLLLGFIFQVTHTNELVQHPDLDARGRLPGGFAEHVLATTADFGVESRWLAHLTGGLNTHAVHHLLPTLSQVHLRDAASVLDEVCRESGVEYKRFPTWRAAIGSHFRALKALGVAPVEPSATR